jgi:hypothetical protein
MSNLEMKFEGEKQGDHLELKRKDEDTTEKNEVKKDLSLEIFEKMQKTFLDKMPEEEREAYQKFGEKFYNNFDVTKGEAIDFSNICMEEALSYVVETLKSGLHPKYLDEDDKALLEAGYGENWFENWGYKEEDMTGSG